MKNIIKLFAFFALLQAAGAAPKDFILICIDDLRPELGSYSVDYISSPNIDALAKRGRVFNRHYVQAPTCGASRYALFMG
ncbi:MAG: sulfatase-like hydrolase/transferase [Verrucomicrobia bacterium]|jgi:iduronate 2-sulfatase|nr:sulfatase-like hydrolase/transferase [Verrucomicrobiota bacterium]|tara:strand:+ start:23384 stop:23623 length:240 start_codon:yes stop_codon:yes gene_type:complete